MTMPKKTLPRIKAVRALPGSRKLEIQWDNGLKIRADISSLIGQFRFYAPLRRSDKQFAAVRVGDIGTDIVWDCGVDMSADTLWRLCMEQSGLTMSSAALRDWRKKRSLSLEAAAEALGISRRMIAYYESGKKPVPRVVALATRGLDA